MTLPRSYRGSIPFGRMGLANETVRRLTPRWSRRVRDKVPSPNVGAHAAQLNR
jgi:hypothetical protein